MSKLQRISSMPKQSLIAMKVAFGIRAQYTTIAMLSILMLTQIAGVVIFSGKAQAAGEPLVNTTNVVGSLTSRTLHGTFTPPDGVTERGFEFGTSISYGQQLPNDSDTYSHSLNKQWGSAGSDDGQFGSATNLGIAIEADDEGNSYVLDPQNNRIQKFDAQGEFVIKWGNDAGGDYDMTQARDMAFNVAGNLLVLYRDPSLIREYTTSGVYVGSWSVPTYYPYDNSRLDVGDDGSVYILYGGGLNYADQVRKFTSTGVNTGTVWAVGVSGARDITVTSDKVYVLNSGKTIQEFTLEGVINDTHTYFPDRVYCDGGCIDIYSMNRLTSDEDGYIYASSWLVGRKYDQNFDIVSEWDSEDRYGIAVSKDLGYIYSVGGNFVNAVVNQYAPAITATVEDLQCNTMYFYRAYATNGSGTSYGQNQTFTTESCAEILTSSLDAGYENEPYLASIQTTNLHGGNVFSIISGQLPSGLTLNANTGQISGTPEYGSGGSYTVTVMLTDDMGGTTADIDLYITPHTPFTVPHSNLDDGRVGDAYDYQLSSSGATGPVAYEVISGTLPPGITMDVAGEFTGTPTTTGVYDFRVKGTDLLDEVEKDLTIEILPALPLPPANSPIVTITSPASETVYDYTQDSVAVSGTGPANQTITTYMDGQQLGTVVVDPNGNWQYTVNNVFPGTHSFDAKYVPIGDLAILISTSEATGFAAIDIVDTGSMQKIHTVYLPQGELTYYSSAVISNDGTKAYITGPALAAAPDYLRYVHEIDLVSGLISRSVYLPVSEYGLFGSMTITDDNQAYIVASLNEETPSPFISKINLDSMMGLGRLLELDPSNSYTNDSTDPSGSASLVSANGRLYSPLSTQNDDDLQTATVITLSNNSIASVPILDEPLWEDCIVHAIKAGDDVYYMANNKLTKMNTTTGLVASTITVDGLESGTTCARSIQIDVAQQKAYILAEGKLFAVNLATQVTTQAPLMNSAIMYDALVATAIRAYEFTHPGEELTEELLDSIAGAALNGIPSEIAAQPSSLIALDSSGNRLHIVWYNGFVASYDVANNAYTSFNGSYFGYGGFSMQQGAARILTSTAVPMASTSFTIDLQPFEPPLIVCDGCDPEIEDPEEPTITNVTPPAPTKTSPIKAPQKPATPQNSLLALVGRIPEPFAIGFPWFLLALALILIGMQYYQVHAEAASTKRMQSNVVRQKQLVEEQNNFVALSTHYLHTPLTVMEGEISLMVKAGTITQEQATKLQSTLASLNAEAEAALAQEEQSE